MDILKEIENQILSIKEVDISGYLDSIFTHIQRAELYYGKGKEDVNFFNDVIYRSNQAYEGALKESYKILADKTQDEVIRKTPNDIEKFFETNSIFRDRVLQLFRNYRQEWRNKSTHDYKLFFDENEAFLALTSVTSFVHLLLKQIQEKAAFLSQQKKIGEDLIATTPNLNTDSNKTPIEKLIELILKFVEYNGVYIHNSPSLLNIQLIGIFHAFIATNEKIVIKREPLISHNNISYRPDFIIEIDSEEIILEFKKYNNSTFIEESAVSQITSFMHVGNINKGIIFILDIRYINMPPIIENKVIAMNNKVYNITIIKA